MSTLYARNIYGGNTAIALPTGETLRFSGWVVVPEQFVSRVLEIQANDENIQITYDENEAFAPVAEPEVTPPNTDDGLDYLNYGRLFEVAESRGLEVVQGQTTRAELLQMLREQDQTTPPPDPNNEDADRVYTSETLLNMTKGELVELATQRGVAFRNTQAKAQIAELILEAQASANTSPSEDNPNPDTNPEN